MKNFWTPKLFSFLRSTTFVLFKFLFELYFANQFRSFNFAKKGFKFEADLKRKKGDLKRKKADFLMDHISLNVPLLTTKFLDPNYNWFPNEKKIGFDLFKCRTKPGIWIKFNFGDPLMINFLPLNFYLVLHDLV